MILLKVKFQIEEASPTLRGSNLNLVLEHSFVGLEKFLIIRHS